MTQSKPKKTAGPRGTPRSSMSSNRSSIDITSASMNTQQPRKSVDSPRRSVDASRPPIERNISFGANHATNTTADQPRPKAAGGGWGFGGMSLPFGRKNSTPALNQMGYPRSGSYTPVDQRRDDRTALGSANPMTSVNPIEANAAKGRAGIEAERKRQDKLKREEQEANARRIAEEKASDPKTRANMEQNIKNGFGSSDGGGVERFLGKKVAPRGSNMGVSTVGGGGGGGEGSRDGGLAAPTPARRGPKAGTTREVDLPGMR